MEGLRHLLQEIHSGPRETRRARLEDYKELLNQKDERATQLVQNLWEASRKNVPSSTEALKALVRKSSLPFKARDQALRGIENYEKRRERIREILDDYPSPAMLFRACFGSSPRGKVEVRVASASVALVIYDEEDYADAYIASPSPTPAPMDPETWKAQHARALLSGGCACPATQIPRSDHLFTLVNAEDRSARQIMGEQAHPAHVLKATEHQRCSHPKRIRVGQGTVDVELEIVWSNNHLKALEIRASQRPFGCQIETIQHTNKGESGVHVRFPGTGSGSVFFRIIRDMVMVQNHYSRPVELQYTSHTFSATEIVDTASVQGTIDHEDQHQWNSLFKPTHPFPPTPKERMEQIVLRSREHPMRGIKEALDFFIERSIHDTNSGSVASRAEIRGRDEILAFYRGGRGSKQIRNSLNWSPLYRYFESIDPKTPGQPPAHLKNELQRYVKQYQATYTEQFPDLPAPPPFTEQDLNAYIELLKKRYTQRIEHGIQAIEILEQTGLSRDTILAKLYKANLPEWLPLARRYKKRMATP